jgi:hypothetical protein
MWPKLLTKCNTSIKEKKYSVEITHVIIIFVERRSIHAVAATKVVKKR